MLSAKFETIQFLLEKDDNKCDYLSWLVFKLKNDYEEIVSFSYCHLFEKWILSLV